MTEAVDAGLGWTVQHAYRGSEFFRRKLDAAGVDPHSIRSEADLPRLPLTTKQELREAYPFGWTCVPPEQVVRIHASTGTTGRRILATYTANDLEDWAAMFQRCYEFAGVTAADRVQITPGYGLWTAGIGFQAGAERLGATAVPTGPGNLNLQFEVMLDLQSTVLCATSSFALLIAEETQRRGLNERLALRVGVFGSERWGEAMRSRIEELLKIETFDIYGFTELYGPGMGLDCREHEGIHYWDDYYLVEVIDHASEKVLAAGEEGELVVTTLRKQAQPLLRYRTHDLSRIIPEPCPCGSPFPRIERLKGRVDDMFKVRGVAVFPAQIDTVLSAQPGLGSEYQVLLTRREGRDRFLIRVEAPEVSGTEVLSAALRQELGVRPEIEIVPPGSLPRTDRKTKRVVDERG
ncbi:MAG: phenylacetate--CoA ligase family protein [Candidatus Dormibacter sp.]|uniref:phenylacetate--CoA ligase family protein n=1 Tax=Candidatus Dormibacter sp. TaxID=2973982 RepID=UPI000DB03170|nr:MAG: phenylacetate--CoA ligase [Candidatus Dormibacteraeota bacterium]